MSGSGSYNGPNKRLEIFLDLLNRKQARMDHIEHEAQVEHDDWVHKNMEVNQGEGGPGESPRGQIEEELGKDLKRVALPKFDGKSIRARVEAWIIEMEIYFRLRNLSNHTKAMWDTYQLSREATTCWDNEKIERNLQLAKITWELFLQYFRKRWLLKLFFNKTVTKFQNLTQGSMVVTQYWENFTNLLKYVPQYQGDEHFRI